LFANKAFPGSIPNDRHIQGDWPFVVEEEVRGKAQKNVLPAGNISEIQAHVKEDLVCK